MSEDGYTAADALAALAIVGLAITGLLGGLRVIGVAQAGVGATLDQAVSIRTAGLELQSLLAGEGPFRSDARDGLVGEADAFSFPCGAGRCGARLESGRLVVEDEGVGRTVALPRTRDLRFEYVGALSADRTWPPAPLPAPAPAWQPLRTVLLKDANTTVATAQVWAAQTADCEFDVVTRDCRGTP